jgi:hypothetical protein
MTNGPSNTDEYKSHADALRKNLMAYYTTSLLLFLTSVSHLRKIIVM